MSESRWITRRVGDLTKHNVAVTRDLPGLVDLTCYAPGFGVVVELNRDQLTELIGYLVQAQLWLDDDEKTS